MDEPIDEAHLLQLEESVKDLVEAVARQSAALDSLESTLSITVSVQQGILSTQKGTLSELAHRLTSMEEKMDQLFPHFLPVSVLDECPSPPIDPTSFIDFPKMSAIEMQAIPPEESITVESPELPGKGEPIVNDQYIPLVLVETQGESRHTVGIVSTAEGKTPHSKYQRNFAPVNEGNPCRSFVIKCSISRNLNQGFTTVYLQQKSRMNAAIQGCNGDSDHMAGHRSLRRARAAAKPPWRHMGTTAHGGEKQRHRKWKRLRMGFMSCYIHKPRLSSPLLSGDPRSSTNQAMGVSSLAAFRVYRRERNVVGEERKEGKLKQAVWFVRTVVSLDQIKQMVQCIEHESWALKDSTKVHPTKSLTLGRSLKTNRRVYKWTNGPGIIDGLRCRQPPKRTHGPMVRNYKEGYYGKDTVHSYSIILSNDVQPHQREPREVSPVKASTPTAVQWPLASGGETREPVRADEFSKVHRWMIQQCRLQFGYAISTRLAYLMGKEQESAIWPPISTLCVVDSLHACINKNKNQQPRHRSMMDTILRCSRRKLNKSSDSFGYRGLLPIPVEIKTSNSTTLKIRECEGAEELMKKKPGPGIVDAMFNQPEQVCFWAAFPLILLAILNACLTWQRRNALMARNGRFDESPDMLIHIGRGDIKGELFTATAAILCIADMNPHQWGKPIHAHAIRNGWDYQVCEHNTLVEMYGKCGNSESALPFVVENKSIIPCSSMIKGYVKHELNLEVSVVKAFLISYVKCGCIEMAERLFSEEVDSKDIISGLLLSVYTLSMGNGVNVLNYLGKCWI